MIQFFKNNKISIIQIVNTVFQGYPTVEKT